MWHFHKWIIEDVQQVAITPFREGMIVGYHTTIKKKCKRCGASKIEGLLDFSQFDTINKLKLKLSPEMQAKLEAHWERVGKNL